jgi:hypothetical protein
VDVDFFKMRIESIRDASARSRWVFAVATVASLAQIGATWNGSASWLRHFALGAFADDPVVVELQKNLLRGWVESLFISVPLLGIRFTNSDASIIGSVALTIISIWLFYAMRRENHLIGQAIRDAADEPQEIKAFVYYGVSGTQVFATLSGNDAPFRSVRESNRRTVFGIRRLSRALVYLPALAIGLIIVSDVASLFWLERLA